MRDLLRGLRCNGLLGRSRFVVDLPACFIALFLGLYSSPLLASCCSCLIFALPAAAALLAAVVPFICASPSTALARAGRLLPRQLYRPAAIQARRSHGTRSLVPLGDSGIARRQWPHLTAI